MGARSLVDVLACEERLVNCWPALDTLLMDGWVIRYANGYSGRANSASAVSAKATLSGALLDEVCGFFRARGLPPAIRVTPLAEKGLDARLEQQGWQAVTRSVGMIGAARTLSRLPDEFEIAPTASLGWIEGVTALQEARKRNPDHLAAIVGRIRRPTAFAMIRREGKPVAFGLCVLDRGMAEIGSIAVDPAYRGAGLGRGLVSGLIDWASRTGAERIFLQVEASNAIARGLYASLGLVDLYDYCEYRQL